MAVAGGLSPCVRGYLNLARQVATEVRLVGLTGNHDRLAGPYEALAQRYRRADNVTTAGPGDRIYETYCEHLLAFTHGDYSEKKMRRFQDVLNAEARSKLSSTTWTTVYTGHLHHKAQDLKDKAGRLHIQASSPSPDDDWHRSEAHVGARKHVQLHMVDPETATDTTFSVAA